MMESFPPIPAPPLLIAHLLGLLFIIHVLFMNYVIAAPLLSGWFLWSKPEVGRKYATWLMSAVPVVFTFAINFGVACLLFVQVLYPERFYTANIILGHRWLAIIGLLMAAFYLCYILLRWLFNPARSPVLCAWTGVVIAALVLSVGGLMTANYFLSTGKVQWLRLLARPGLVMESATFLPRFLHMAVGAFSVAGLWMVWISWWRQKREGATAELSEFRRQGLYVATGATGLQIVIGIWFLLTLPSEVWDQLFSGTFPSLVWIAGVACGLSMFGLLMAAIANPDKRVWQKGATHLLAATLIGMVAGRDVVRRVAFAGDTPVADLPSRTQSEPMMVFAIVLILGLVTLLWLYRKIRRLPVAK
ncbi:hypothetical protein KKH27_13080 [bacterium]|nr:hypothetical protein [bacterium]MBU1983441.1 hypothetical protein [bacterium]